MKTGDTFRPLQFSAQDETLADGEERPVLLIQNRISETESRTAFLLGRHLSCSFVVDVAFVHGKAIKLNDPRKTQGKP